MKPSSFLSCLLLAAACGAAHGAPAAAASTPRAAASAACPATTAPSQPERRTSKVRHVPDERDPCADSRGVAPVKR